MVEDEEQQNKEPLVEELTPTLHQEGAGDLPATVQTVILRRDFTRANGVLHARRCSHRVLAADTDTVDEQRQDVADDPAVPGNTPGAGEHNQTDSHDGGILDKTPATANPVTEESDEDLT